jgi:hypothetical protein
MKLLLPQPSPDPSNFFLLCQIFSSALSSQTPSIYVLPITINCEARTHPLCQIFCQSFEYHDFIVIHSILPGQRYVTTVTYILSTGATIQMFQELVTKMFQSFCGEKNNTLKRSS